MIYAARLIWAGNDNNNSVNFICVFEGTIANLATYRQFTNAAWDWMIQKNKTKRKQKKKEKKRNQNNNNNNNNNNNLNIFIEDCCISFKKKLQSMQVLKKKG